MLAPSGRTRKHRPRNPWRRLSRVGSGRQAIAPQTAFVVLRGWARLENYEFRFPVVGAQAAVKFDDRVIQPHCRVAANPRPWVVIDRLTSCAIDATAPPLDHDKITQYVKR